MAKEQRARGYEESPEGTGVWKGGERHGGGEELS